VQATNLGVYPRRASDPTLRGWSPSTSFSNEISANTLVSSTWLGRGSCASAGVGVRRGGVGQGAHLDEDPVHLGVRIRRSDGSNDLLGGGGLWEVYPKVTDANLQRASVGLA
jgi:hypothetical protein